MTLINICSFICYATSTNVNEISILLNFVVVIWFFLFLLHHRVCINFKLYFIFFLVRSEFIFVNPNSKGQCGCGESFMTTSNSPAAKQGTG